jgi:hypothetical protein
MGNRKTFPSALGQFCFELQPPIILTHWDFDHWSSANLSGGKASWHSTWIAPRQHPVGPTHHTLMRQIRKFGTLLLVPKARKVSISAWRGRFLLERCTGSGRNHSGFAVTLSQKSLGKGRKILFPGDASYNYIQSFSGSSYVSVIAPHHGADMKNRMTPPAPPDTASRLVYSYGNNNTFKHPRKVTRKIHHIAGWLDLKATKGIKGPHKARNTADRNASGLGHVVLNWSKRSTLSSLCCQSSVCRCSVAGRTCDLQPQQL